MTSAATITPTFYPTPPIVQGFSPRISVKTACRFLCDLGFQRVDSSKKGVYIDGHERQDVVEERTRYLDRVHERESNHLPSPSPSDVLQEHQSGHMKDQSATKWLVTIFHDESTFQSNEDQRYMWCQPDQTAIKPKSRGSGRMVNDFIDEYSGYLRLSPSEVEAARVINSEITNEARQIIEYGENRDGYWTGDKFMSQVKRAVAIADFKYPSQSYALLWIFDHSCNHTVKSHDALVASRMNVGLGGKQPSMRDTMYQGKEQKLVTGEGVPKGLRMVLTERGINVSNMCRDQMVSVLSEHDDFVNEKSAVELYLESRGHYCLFIPKYHYELNPIERVWGHAKKYTRAYCNYSITGLRKTMTPALEIVDVDLIRIFLEKLGIMFVHTEKARGLERKWKIL